jgi:hypothetical protein
MSAVEWVQPDFAEGDLVYRFGESVVEEFALGHTASDVLRELCQNEYDASGDHLLVRFGEEALEVSGTGRVIDRAGWQRLSVVLGTGQVAGAAEHVAAKVNGIGSKNQGLRSLFRVGDRIFVRSGGRQALLDWRHGTSVRPLPDSSTKGSRGVRIFVPYRAQANGRLGAFDSLRELRDLEEVAAQLAPTLLKLADAGGKRSLGRVTVTSERWDRKLEWRQQVKRLGSHRLRGPILQRTVTLETEADGDAAMRRITELEYQGGFEIPGDFAEHVFPSYFRMPGGRLRLGISLPLKRKRPDREQRGSFYYPLACSNGRTGSAISVNGPFELNSDRSTLLDPGTSRWNEWLLNVAADFALSLLVEEWFSEFGADSYRIIAPAVPGSVAEFGELLKSGLSSRPCWRTRARQRGSKRATFATAEALTLEHTPELGELIEDERRLHPDLTHPDIHELAESSGAKPFTVGSAVRLRCAGEDISELATTLGDDGALYYTDFPEPLRDVGLQERFGRAFESQWRKLTKHHYQDLKESPTTLTAAGTLEPAGRLWIVDDELAGIVPLGREWQLHPRLAAFKTIARRCQRFDISKWAVDVAERAAVREANESELDALYRYLLRSPETIGRTAWQTLRRCPVVRDHRGDWVAASEIIEPGAAGAKRLEPVLSFPSRELARSPRAVKALRFRKKLKGADIVRYAENAANNPELANDIEANLYELQRFLTPKITGQLRSLRILRSLGGVLLAPEQAYVRTSRLVACLGEHPAFAIGRHTALHERLQARTEPEADDILSFVEELRATDAAGPPNPNVLYPELVDALRRGYGDSTAQENEPIIFAGDQWVAPTDCLIGKRNGEIFIGAVPILSGALADVYESLGAVREPTTEHWRLLFHWLASHHDGDQETLTPRERATVRRIYTALRFPPDGLEASVPMLLDDRGRLHALSEARAQRFLINDDPALAAALERSTSAVAFADTEPGSLQFFRSAGVHSVTSARQRVETKIGNERSGPHWVKEPERLERLHRPVFSAAVHALAAFDSSTAASERELARALKAIHRIVFVEEIEHIYRIGPFSRVGVAADVALDGERIALVRVHSRAELDGALALVIAELADSTPAAQFRLADGIFRLLACRREAEIDRYLSQRGIPWRSSGASTADEEEEEDGPTLDGIAEALTRGLVDSSSREHGGQVPPEAPDREEGEVEKKPPKRKPLPPLDDVQVHELALADWTPPEPRPGGGGGGGLGSWRLRTAEEQEADRAVGRRGEELVYREEVKRVKALGFPESRVIWSSERYAASDHDILSVADDGEDLWLEVKATTGRDGRFDWPRSEFELALDKREKYVLCRVYEADTKTASILRQPDPLGLLLAGKMRLDLATLAAEIAPLGNAAPASEGVAL